MLNPKHIFMAFILLSVEVYALSLDEIIDKSLMQNPSLESITHKINANRSSINLSNQFANPTLSYSQNTISANEPMSQKVLTLAQKIYFYGKRDVKKEIAQADENILHVSLKEAKINLIKAIKERAYSIWKLQELYKIVEKYENITRQKIELSESYTSTSANQHMGIMSAELTLSDLRIEKSAIKAKITDAYAKLSYLASFEIDTLDLSLHVNSMPSIKELQKSLTNNSSLALKEREIQKSKKLQESAALQSYPDINLVAGYAYRENFDNFFNFGVALSLPIYGSETYKQERAREMTLLSQSLKQDISIEISSELKTAYAQMYSAYEIYHIVQDEALPQIEHMFDLSDSSISTGGDLFKYIDILTQKLKLERKSIAAVEQYYKFKAEISALMGEIR